LPPGAIATVSRCVEAIATSMGLAEVIDLTRLSRRQQVTRRLRGKDKLL